MSDHTDDTKTNLRLPEEAQTCEASPADDTSAIQEALAQEIQNVTADIPKLDLTGISEEEPQPSLPEEASSTGSVSEQEPVSSWFLTFMCMNIPIAGWFYLFRLAFNKKKYPEAEFCPGLSVLQTDFPGHIRRYSGHTHLCWAGSAGSGSGIYGDALKKQGVH